MMAEIRVNLGFKWLRNTFVFFWNMFALSLCFAIFTGLSWLNWHGPNWMMLDASQNGEPMKLALNPIFWIMGGLACIPILIHMIICDDKSDDKKKVSKE